MTKPFKPLLALSEEVSGILDQLPYPLFMSGKMDGIRNTVHDGQCLSRKLIAIPNQGVQTKFGNSNFNFMDGELICGSVCAPDVYNTTFKATMKVDRTWPVDFHVFDHFEFPDEPYYKRLERLMSSRAATLPWFTLVDQKLVHNPDEVLAEESRLLELGYEGGILRHPEGRYKFGRSTLKEAYALKLKRFADDEAVVVGFVEGMSNTNEAVKDNLGNTKRSSQAEGKVPNGMLGNFIALYQGREVLIPPGVMKHDERLDVFQNQMVHLGRMIKFRHFPHGAVDDLRHARFMGWRSPIDL